MLISHVTILLITKINVPETDLSLGYLLIIDTIFDLPLFKLFAKAKENWCREYTEAVRG